MIFDNFDNINTYFKFSPYIKRIHGIISLINEGKFDFEKPILYDDGFKIILVSKDIENNKTDYCLERHQLYIDFHYVIEGLDEIGIRNVEKCLRINKTYNTEGDYELFNDEPEYLFKLNSGDFLIITPSHAHETLLSKGFVRKIVFKIPIG
jgi:YhcH/YjgK/YiaL family protein